MASSGPNYPGTGASLANAGTSENANGWTNPGNVGSSSAVASITAATFDSPDISEILVASNFGFSLPNSTINGITVEIRKRGYTSTNSGKDFRVQLSTSTAFSGLVGSNKATADVWPQTTLATTTYGGSADTWSAGLTYSQINSSSFAVFVSAYANVANADIDVDWIRVTVTYTENYTLTVPLIDVSGDQAIYAPTVINLLQFLTVPLIDASRAIYAPTVIPDQLLTLPLLDNTEAAPAAPVYSDVVLADSPIAYWRLGDASGDAQDSTANNYDMTYSGGVTYAQTSLLATDTTNKSVALDDTSSGFAYRQVSSGGLALGDNFTIEAWIHPTSVSFYRYIYSAGVGTGAPRLFMYGGELRFSVGSVVIRTSSISLLANHTYHVVATKNGTDAYIYVNGVDVTVYNSDQTADNSQTVNRTIGCSSVTADYFGGRIDEVALYSTALTLSQVGVHFRAGVGASYDALVKFDSPIAYWRLGEASGYPQDSSGNGHHATSSSGSFTYGQAGALVGDSDDAIGFPTVADRFGIPHSTAFNVGDVFTAECWVKRSSVNAADCFIGRWDSAGWSIGVTATGQLWAFGGGGTAWYTSSETPLNDTNWHHIVVTKNGSTRAGYVDGVLMTNTASNTNCGDPAASVEFVLGGWRMDVSDGFAGDLDEAAVYNYVLTADQVLAHYARGQSFGTKKYTWDNALSPWTVINFLDGAASGARYASGGSPDSSGFVELYAVSNPDDTDSYLILDTTWEGLGVPAGATVTRARLRSVWRSMAVSGTDSGGTGIFLLSDAYSTFATLLADTTSAISSWTESKVGSWADFTDQESSASFYIALHAWAFFAGGDGDAAPHWDSLYIDIEYTAGAGGGGGRVLYAPTVTALESETDLLTVPLLDASNAIYAPSLIYTQTLTVPEALDGGATIYAPTVVPDQLITPTLIDAGAAIYAPTLTGINLLTATLIDAGSAIYAPVVMPDQFLTATLIDASNAIYAPTLTGINLLTVPVIESTATIYAPSVYPAQFLTVPLVETTPALYAPTLLLAPYPIVLTLIDGEAALYAPTVTKVGALPQDIILILLDAVAEIYAPVVMPDQFLTVPVIESAPEIYAPTVVPDQLLTVPLIDAVAEIYAPTVMPDQYLTVPVIESTPALYAPTLTLAFAVPFIDAGNAIYAPVLTPVNTLVVGIIDAGNAIYVVTLSGTLAIPLIDGARDLWEPTLTLAPYPIILTLIDGVAMLYDPVVTALGSLKTITLTLLDGEAAVYAPAVLAEQDLVVPAALDGGATLYVPTLLPFNLLTVPAALDGGASIYAPTLTTRYVIVLPQIDAVADLYAPTVLPGPVTVVVPLAGNDPVLYAPTVVQEATKVVVPFLDGEGAIYTLAVALAAVTISGYTRTCDGAILPFATIDVFRSSDNAWLTTVVSDALGHYSVLVTPGVEHYLVAFHATNVYGVTARDLVGA